MSLSSDGKIGAIGATWNVPWNVCNVMDAGHVGVFQWNGTAWIQLGKDINGKAAGDYCGASVSLSSDGTSVAIGEPRSNNFTGRARVFQWNGTFWNQLGSDMDGQVLDWFGFSVSLSSCCATVAVGTPYSDGNGNNAKNVGHVRVIQWDGTAWNQLGNQIDGEAENDQCGYSVSLSSDGKIVAIGTLRRGLDPHPGHVRVYSYTDKCTVDECDPNTGVCTYTPKCDDGNECTNDECNPNTGDCAHTPKCDDGNKCTIDECDPNTGVCTHTPIDCDDKDLCTANGCNPKTGCTHTPKCDDGSKCTIDECDPNTGVCTHTPIDCDDKDLCTTNGCNPKTGCTHTPKCDDLNKCTIDACDPNNGVCTHTPAADDCVDYCLAVACDAATSTSTTWNKLGKDFDVKARDQSGYSVSLSSDGNIVAIGAIWNDGSGEDAGHVQVFQWNGTAWNQLGKDINGQAAGDGFGWSVSLSSDGKIVAIGAPYNDGNGNWAGHVRVFQWNGIGWNQLGNDMDGKKAEDRFGYSVSLSSDGKIMATGALFNNGNDIGSQAGQVRVFQWKGTAWNQLGKDINGQAAGDESGYSVSLSSDGQTVAIGAPWNYFNRTNAGNVRIFQWNGTTWKQLGKDINGQAAGDNSGHSVSLSSDGQTVAIGAPGRSRVRVFQWNGTAWNQLGDYIYGEGTSGFSVSLSSCCAAVAIGAPYNDGNGKLAGQVRVFQWDGTAWNQFGEDIYGEAGDISGFSVSLSSDGETVAIGAPENVQSAGSGNFAGHVRVYSCTV